MSNKHNNGIQNQKRVKNEQHSSAEETYPVTEEKMGDEIQIKKMK